MTYRTRNIAIAVGLALAAMLVTLLYVVNYRSSVQHAQAMSAQCIERQAREALEAEGTPPFGGLPIDFAYIDGMHLLEYALRDFIGVEQYSARSSVVAFDDVLPRNVEEAARDRHVMPWTGDVFRIPLVLTEHRPDLVVLSTSPYSPASNVPRGTFGRAPFATTPADRWPRSSH